MELNDDYGRRIRSSYEIAQERFKYTPPVEESVNPATAMPDPDATYDESIFVKEDHITIRDNTFLRSPVKAPNVLPSTQDHEPDEDTFQLDNLTALTSVNHQESEMPNLPEVLPEEYEVATQWGGPMFDYGGFARMNRSYIIGLKRRGALIRTRCMDTITDVNRKTEDFLRQLEQTKIPGKYPRVYGMTIPDLIAHSGPKILYTMMETSNKIHPELAERYNMADEIWVPCTWNKEVYENSGVSRPINVMPLGVDTNQFKPGDGRIDLKAKEFRFLAVSGWSYRKGFDVLIQSFLEEFSSKDNVSLVIASKYVGQIEKKNRIISDFSYIKSLVSKPESELPHVCLYSAKTKDSDMPHLYNSAHCFVLPSRGEGWGLPYIEAGACGLPVIASDHGGQRDFLDEEVAYMVPPDGYFVSNREDPQFRNLAWISHFYEGQEFPHFGRPAMDLIKGHMRHVFENYSEAKEKGSKLRQRLVDKFQWSHAIDRVYSRLKEICSELG